MGPNAPDTLPLPPSDTASVLVPSTSEAQSRKPRQGAPSPGPLRALRPLRGAIPTFRSRSTTTAQHHNALFQGKPFHLVISAIVLTVLVTAIISAPILPGQVDIQPGMPAAQDIYSPTYLRYDSKLLTDQARTKAAEDQSNEVWVQNTDLIQQNRAILDSNLAAVAKARENANVDTPNQPRPAVTFQGITVTEQMLNMLAVLPLESYQSWRDNAVLASYDANMRGRRLASDADVAGVRAALPDRLPSELSPLQREAAVAFVSPMLVVNMKLDDAQTSERRNQAAANVKPVVQIVQKGEVIMRQGELATPEAIEKMQEAGLLRRDLSFLGIVSMAALVGMFMLILHLYIYRYAPHVWHRQRQLMLIGLLVVVTITVARLFLPGHTYLPYLLPLAAVSMLVAALVDTNVAVVLTVVLAVLTGLIAASTNLSMDLVLYYAVGGLVGSFSLTRVERVSTFARAGLFVAVASFLTILALKAITGTPLDWPTLQNLALAVAFNGFVSASITYAAFSLLGTLFGITTPVQLMELAHPDQPVLRKLMQEAPGTYHHSLVVSNLAERAAEMIGADALLTRVSAYYHDIGKVMRPYYFIDNQSGMKNIHDELDPHESARIIAGHVIDGVEMGKKSHLPRRVLDAIPQHHGTMLIQYFYYKALQNDPNTNPDDFRYPGPKPQTKENAILMLADGVEATVRAMAQAGALDKPQVRNSDISESPGLYKDAASLPDDVVVNTVHKIISDRIEDGQLDECDLTVRDIARIQEAFVSMLKGIYHPRIQYPGAPSSARTTPPADAAPVPVEEPVLAQSPAGAGNGRHDGNGNGHGTEGLGSTDPLVMPEDAQKVS